MLESDFKRGFIKKLKEYFIGCVFFLSGMSAVQGFPDLIILYNDKWAALEFKKSKNAKKRPNQDYYISKMKKHTFAVFVYPENEAEVFDGLKKYFGKTK